MQQVAEAIPEDELARRDTMPMSNKCLSNKSMNSNKCAELLVSSLSMVVKEDMGAGQHRGRECMMMFRNPMYQAEVEEQLEGDIKEDAEVAVQGVPLHHKLDLQVLRLPMRQLDQRTLESLVRTIVEEVGAVIGASTRMLAVKIQRDAFLFGLLHYFGTLVVGLGISKVHRGWRPRKFPLSVTIQCTA